MPELIRLPQAMEIRRAREQVCADGLEEHANGDTGRRLMQSWSGQCWHKNEILFGILIGLQIAQDRKEGKSSA